MKSYYLRVMIVKTDSFGSVIYAYPYTDRTRPLAFDIDSSETYIYLYHFYSIAAYLSVISTSNGISVISKKLSTPFAFYNAMAISLYSNTLFFSTNYFSLKKMVVCSTDPNMLVTAQCIICSSIDPTRNIISLSSSDILTITRDNTTPFTVRIMR